LKIISTKNFLKKGYNNSDRNARHDQQVITSMIASVNTIARRRCAKSKGEGRIQYKREIEIITWVGNEIYTQRFIVAGSSNKGGQPDRVGRITRIGKLAAVVFAGQVSYT
jgi:hypothetical protein